MGPASQGHNLLELDGTNGVFVQINNVPSSGLLLQGDYSPRRGYDQVQNEIEVLWNGNLIATLARDGRGNQTTDFERFQFTLPVNSNQTSGRLEFRSTTQNDTLAVGGLLDDIKVFEFDNANRAPQLNPIGDQAVNEGESLTVQFSATDADSSQNQLRFSTPRAPVGSTLDPVTGVFRWTPNESAGGRQFGVDVVVTDETGRSDMQTFRVTVNEVPNAPQLQPIDDQSVTEGQALSLQLVATDSDSAQHQLRYSATRCPVGSTLDPVTGVFKWTPNEYAGGLRFGVDVVVTDETGLKDTQTFRVFVNDAVNQAPQLQPIDDQTVNEGQTLSVQLVATDADSPQNQLRYSAPRAPAGSTLDPVTGLFEWTPNQYAGGLRFGVDVVVTDETGLTDTKTFRVSVTDLPNQAPQLQFIDDQTVTERDTLTVQLVATDADSAQSQLRYSAPRAPFGSTLDPVTGIFKWTPNQFAGGLRFGVDVVVTDETGLTDEQTFWINVNDIDGSPVLEPISDQNTKELETLTVQLVATDSNSDQSQLRYAALRSPIGSTLDPVTGLFKWTPNRWAGGFRFGVDVRVTDETGFEQSENISDRG